MAFFAKSLGRSTKKRAAEPVVRDELDDFLSSDLDLSIVSLNSPPDPSPLAQRQPASRKPFGNSPVPMDISPMPAANKGAFPNRGLTARAFGRDVGNTLNSPSPSLHPGDATKSSNSKGRQRSALPSQWMVSPAPVKDDSEVLVVDRPITPIPNSSLETDAMDVDTPPPATASAPASPNSKSLAAKHADQGDLSALFYESTSPAVGPAVKKRRSMSPEPSHYEEPSSSPAPPSSPAARKFERFASTGYQAGPLFKKPAAVVANPNKRPRRPVLSAILPSNEPIKAQSAYPDLEDDGGSRPMAAVPVRRAFSQMVAPDAFVLPACDMSSDDMSGSVEGSSPAGAYARRQEERVHRKVDLRPLPGAHVLGKRERDNLRNSPGLPGFGDCEAAGKLLPCHKVKEDGLMRIEARTVNDLLNGAYAHVVPNFVVIDCRFDYEYDGGHIPGAINLNTTGAIEDFLLGMATPTPSTSGDGEEKTVLIFHCEFSAKRAPTFAKSLRSKDRSLNHGVYPKIHYPEIYILSGGYCQFYKEYPQRCEPPAYVQMDDPAHARACERDMDKFRKWNRTRSYTYGERPISGQQPKLPHRNSAPSTGVVLPFTAGTAARSRRGGPQDLGTLNEDTDHSGSRSGEDDSHPTDSPCPPPKAGAFKVPLAPKAKTRTLERAATMAPSRGY